MGNADDQNYKFVVPYFVQDTMIACAKTAQPLQIAFQGSANVRVFGKSVDNGDDPHPILFADTLKLFGRTLLNLYRECHAEPFPNPEPDRLGLEVDRWLRKDR